MARRREVEEPENHERWLVSYADFITLLFAFFVTMYALSSVNEGKYRVLSDSLVQAFRNVTVNTSGAAIAPSASMVAVKPVAAAVRKDPKAEERRRVARDKMRNMARDILAAMAPLVQDGKVRVTETARGVTVEINASVLFASGEASLAPSAVRALHAVAEIMAATEFPVTVEGHTDNTPIATSQFPSNWELSVVRASSVVRLFVDAGVQPGHLTATGYGEQRPVADNATPEGRARNRRVSVLIDSPDPDVATELPVAAGASADASAIVPRNGG
jgi:chemotaxis protein MotB